MIMSVIGWFTSTTVGRYVAAGLTFAAVLAWTLLKTFRAGKAANEAKHAAQRRAARKAAEKTEREVDALDDDDRYDAGNRWL